MTDIENIAFRITLGVVRLRCASRRRGRFRASIFASSVTSGDSADNTLALPPYWFFLSDEGNAILDSELKAIRAVGIHVPEAMPDDPAQRPAELHGHDLFTEPGQSRQIAER